MQQSVCKCSVSAPVYVPTALSQGIGYEYETCTDLAPARTQPSTAPGYRPFISYTFPRTVELEHAAAAYQAQIASRHHRPTRGRDAWARPRILERPLSSISDGLLAGVLRQCRGNLRHSQCRVRVFLLARRSTARQCQRRFTVEPVLFLDRDAGHRRLWRYASANRLRPSRRHRRDFHRHVLSRGDDWSGLCPLLAAEGPLRVRPVSGGD